MASASCKASGLPHTWFPALVISSVVSLLCGAALYFLLAQQDRSLVAQRNAAATHAVESSGRALAHAFAWFSESLLNEHLANVQQVLEGPALPIDLLDAAVITEDNLVVAARNPAAIGRQFQDPAWLAARKSQAGSLTPALDRGRQVLVVIEPLRQQERIIGWVRLVLAAPREVAATRSNEDLMRDVAVAIVPLFILTATLVILFLRGIMSRIRSRIGRILLDAMDDSRDPLDKPVELSKAG
jgi:uncharacterized membrane protein affecting hemolysin expression